MRWDATEGCVRRIRKDVEDAMSRLIRSRRSLRRLLLVAFALVLIASLLIASLLSVGPAAGHTFMRTDGKDSPGRLDIRVVSSS